MSRRYHNAVVPYQIDLISEKRIILTTFNSNPANYLNHQSLQDWNNLLDEIESPSNKAIYHRKPIIFTSPDESKHFGSGMDLKSITKMTDPDANKQLFGHFEEIIKRLMLLQHRTIAMIHGHAIGGGFMFGLACDIRCGLSTNDIVLGVNAIDVGLCYPSIVYLMLLQRIPNYANKILTGMPNQLFDAEQAIKYGYLVDTAENKDKLIELCINEALRIDNDSMDAYLSMKNYLFERCIQSKWNYDREDIMNEFIRVRNTPHTQRRLEYMVKKLDERKTDQAPDE